MGLKIQTYNAVFNGEKWEVEFSKYDGKEITEGSEEFDTSDEVLFHYGKLFNVPIRRLDKAE